MSWDFDSFRFDHSDDEEPGESEALQSRRLALLKTIADAANELSEIDKRLALLKPDQKQAAESVKA